MITYEDLSKNEKDKVKVWISLGKVNGKKSGSLSWVASFHQKIHDFIVNHKYVDTSKRDHLSVLSVILRHRRLKTLSEKYNTESREYGTKAEKVERKQGFDKKELKNWVAHEDIIEKLKVVIKDHDKRPSVGRNYRMLALAIYSLQPPIRYNLHHMEITSKPIKELLGKKLNYLQKKDGNYTYVINDDKVQKKYGPAAIPIESKSLTELITQSLEKYPRKWLFTKISDRTTPMSILYFPKMVKSIFKLEKKVVGIDILRSSYITWFYDKYQAIAARDDLAKKMRHSRSIAESNYRKITIENVGNEDELDSEEVPAHPIRREIPKTEIQEKQYFDLAAWSKKYRKEHPEKFTKASKKYYEANKDDVLLKKMLFNLNVSKNVSRPTHESQVKYKLIYNKLDQVWESTL